MTMQTTNKPMFSIKGTDCDLNTCTYGYGWASQNLEGYKD
jgi:hypothetical protein